MPVRLANVVKPLKEATKLDRKQFAVLLGLRAAASTFVPLLIGMALSHPQYQWAGIAGFCATTTDKGGAYRTRAKAFAALLVAGSVSVLIGSLAGGSLLASVVLAFLVVSTGALARVLGNEAISVGTVTSLMFLLANAQPVQLVSEGLDRTAVISFGFMWAAFLGLVVWPVRVYAPARRAVAACFQALATHAQNLTRLVSEVGSTAWYAGLQADHSNMRSMIEAARSQLAGIRSNNRGTSSKGAWLLGLVQTADQAFARVISVCEVLETASATPLAEPVLAEIENQFGEVAKACQALAEFAVDENEHAPVPRADVSVTALGRTLEGVLTPPMSALIRAQISHVGELLMSIDQTLETVVPVANAPHDPRASMRVLLDAARSPDSVEFRHAIRVGLVVAASVAVTALFKIDHGYWATITMLVVLQPHAPATYLRSVQRIGGTVLGALIVVAITAIVPDVKYLIPICMVMSAVSVSVIQVNYGLYAALLTPTFVLLAQVNGLNWRLAGIRALTTAGAGVAALVASRLFWPSSERSRIADELASALKALRIVLAVIAQTPRVLEAEVDKARRIFGVTINNADVSFQRIVAEQSVSDADLEPVMTMLLSMRRFCWAALAVTTLPGAPTIPSDLAQACDGVLNELVDAAQKRRAPQPLSKMGLASTASEPLLHSQLERLVEQLHVLHDAQARLEIGRD